MKIHQQGFTLIELMVAIAVIGLLVALSIVKYNTYANKSREAEAKLALAQIYHLEKSFYSEYSAYAPSFNAIGFLSEGTRRFYTVTLTTDGAVYPGSVTGYSGNFTWPLYWSLSPYGNTGIPYGAPGNCAGYTAAGYSSTDPQAFIAQALGQLKSAPPTPPSLWSISQYKQLQNCINGI